MGSLVFGNQLPACFRINEINVSCLLPVLPGLATILTMEMDKIVNILVVSIEEVTFLG